MPEEPRDDTRDAPASVGVLRFGAAIGDSEVARLARGLGEELTRRLAGTPGLRPVASGRLEGSGDGNGGRPEAATPPGREPQSLLVGTFARGPEGLSVEVRLARPGGTSLWSGRYERSLHDLPAVTDDIVQQVSGVLAPGDGAPSPAPASAAADAFRYYLEGLALAREGGRPAEATDRLRCAVARDAAFAPAHAALGHLYLRRAEGSGPGDTVSLPQARHFARRAVDLDPSQAEGHAVLGRIAHLYERAWASARSHLRDAARHAPGSARTHRWFSELLATLGRTEDAVEAARRAREIEPISPRAGAALGRALLCARRDQEAERRLRTVLDRHPGHVPARRWLAAVHLSRGDDGGAVQVVRAGLSEASGAPLPGLAVVASRVLGGAAPRDVTEDGAGGQQGPEAAAPPVGQAFWTAVGYAVLERPDAAFPWLEQALRDGEPDLRWLEPLPLLDPLRGDGRYRSLVERLGLAPS